MNGALGGLLALVHAIGGGFLYILIGSKGWNSSGLARWMRLAFGSLAIGIGIAIVSIYLNQENGYAREDRSGYFCGFPALILAVVILLEMIRNALKDKDK